ncbi:MAG TPA: AMP-binding protein [Solirubrobacteraceae bacterium]|nr:AMP-binding protein [Solirubrobacteraceae bacterium]
MSAVGERNLARLAEAAFTARGDHPALLFEGVTHTAQSLFQRACRVAGGLAELGVRPGDRVVVCMANCPEVGILYNAIWRAGAVVTPATFLLPTEDLRAQIADSGATVVCTTPEFEDKVSAAAAGLDHVRAVVSTGPGSEGVRPMAELETGGAAPIAARGDDDLAALLYTGGTTGRAKGVMLSHANLHYTGAAAHASAHIPGVNRGLATLPLSHAYGILVTISGLHNPERGFAVLLRWFDPAGFCAMVAEHGLQITAVVPSMLQILLGQPLEDHDLSTLRSIASGGAPLPPEVEAEFCRRVPSATIRQGYGLTETGALISSSPVGRERAGSVGIPVPGCEVVIVDDDGNPVPDGEPGEITAISPGVMQGYWRAPEITAETIRDGRLHTGDIGYRDPDGYLYIVDRKKDLIIRGGFNVYPRDVEDALLEHPAVALAGVVGRPDPRHGEEVVAYVSLAGGASAEPAELVAWARERIGGYKYPREVRVIDAIPLTPVGKIDRKALRGRLAD